MPEGKEGNIDQGRRRRTINTIASVLSVHSEVSFVALLPWVNQSPTIDQLKTN